MKLEIFDKKKIDEPVLRLRLHQNKGCNMIELTAVSENGENVQWLLTIQPDGSITRTTLALDFIENYNLSVDERNKLLVRN
jgi:hypothetical protein